MQISLPAIHVNENADRVAPVILLIDNSAPTGILYSQFKETAGNYVRSLNKLDSTIIPDICIITCSQERIVAREFTNLNNIVIPADLSCSGKADLTGGINKALDKLRTRKMAYSMNNVESLPPVIVVFTTGITDESENSALCLCEQIQAEKCGNLLPVVVGENNQLDYVRHLRKDNQYLNAAHTDFDDLFLWLGSNKNFSNYNNKSCSYYKLDPPPDSIFIDI